MPGKPLIAAPIPLPPPVHGSNVMNQVVLTMLLKGQGWRVQHIPVQFSSVVATVGTFGLGKVVRHFTIVISVVWSLARLRPKVTYLSPAVSGFAWIRDALLIVAARVFSRDVVVHIHGRGLSSAPSNGWLRWMRHTVFNGTHAIHLSEGLAQSIAQVTNWKSLSVVPNGIESVANVQGPAVDSGQTIKLLYLSNFIETKGVLDFVTVCKNLHDQGHQFEASIVGGNGPTIDVGYLQKRIKNDGLDHCVFALGPRYGDDKLQILSDTNLFLFPSFYPQECAPLVVLEALSFGIPVISYDIGAVAEMVEDGRSGFVVPSRDTASMTARVSQLIQDTDLLSSMSLSARSRFDHQFTLQKFETRLHEYFIKLLD